MRVQWPHPPGAAFGVGGGQVWRRRPARSPAEHIPPRRRPLPPGQAARPLAGPNHKCRFRTLARGAHIVRAPEVAHDMLSARVGIRRYSYVEDAYRLVLPALQQARHQMPPQEAGAASDERAWARRTAARGHHG